MKQLATKLRVRFDETDMQGVVHHSVYLKYFELGRVEFFRGIGFDYRDIEASGSSFVVVGAALEYKRPSTFDEELEVWLAVEKVGLASMIFSYEVKRGEEELVSGETKLAFLGKNSRPTRFPKAFRDALRSRLPSHLNNS